MLCWCLCCLVSCLLWFWNIVYNNRTVKMQSWQTSRVTFHRSEIVRKRWCLLTEARAHNRIDSYRSIPDAHLHPGTEKRTPDPTKAAPTPRAPPGAQNPPQGGAKVGPPGGSPAEIFLGARGNSVREIFCARVRFWQQVEHLSTHHISTQEVLLCLCFYVCTSLCCCVVNKLEPKLFKNTNAFTFQIRFDSDHF